MKTKKEENNLKYQNGDKKEDRLDARNEPPRKVERMSTYSSSYFKDNKKKIES
jgi:hypothetical protein